jgi:hypothetical protein
MQHEPTWVPGSDDNEPVDASTDPHTAPTLRAVDHVSGRARQHNEVWQTTWGHPTTRLGQAAEPLDAEDAVLRGVLLQLLCA